MPLKIGMGIVGTLPNNCVLYRSPIIWEHIENLTFDLILQNLAAKLICLSIVVAYMGVQYVLSPNFSKLGHCEGFSLEWFSLILSKVQGGFWSNVSESFIDRCHMNLIIVDLWLTFFRIYCVVLKFGILACTIYHQKGKILIFTVAFVRLHDIIQVLSYGRLNSAMKKFETL